MFISCLHRTGDLKPLNVPKLTHPVLWMYVNRKRVCFKHLRWCFSDLTDVLLSSCRVRGGSADTAALWSITAFTAHAHTPRQLRVQCCWPFILFFYFFIYIRYFKIQLDITKLLMLSINILNNIYTCSKCVRLAKKKIT